jgi:hypothetical protein
MQDMTRRNALLSFASLAAAALLPGAALAAAKLKAGVKRIQSSDILG